MKNKNAGIVLLSMAGILLIFATACSQTSTQQKITSDKASLLPVDAALAYLDQRPELSASRDGVQCRKYENVIEGISTQSEFFRYAELYIYSASVKVAGNDQPRQCLMIGAHPYKSNSFMVGNHSNLKEFFNLNRFGPKVWFRYFAVYECSEAGESMDEKTVTAFLSLGAKIVDESTLDE